MKHLIIFFAMSGLLLFSKNGLSQDRGQMSGMHMQMMEIMKDSSMMKMMMAHIASDDQMRKMMMHQMMASAKGDSSKMMDMCNMTMKDHAMHGMMMKMMDKNMMSSGIMKGDMQTAENSAPEIIVKFKPGTAEAQIKEMEMEGGLERIKDIPGLNMKVYRVTAKTNVAEVIESCQKHPFVVYAETNQKYHTLNMNSPAKKKDYHKKHHE